MKEKCTGNQITGAILVFGGEVWPFAITMPMLQYEIYHDLLYLYYGYQPKNKYL